MKVENKYEIKAVIFDLDATLIDTEPNWFLADRKMLKEYGIDFTMEMKQKYIGKSIQNMIDDLKTSFEIDASFEELYEKKNKYYLEIAEDNSIIFPQMEIILNKFIEMKLPLAVASGTAKTVIDSMFEKMDIKKHFRELVSSEEVEQGKPDPAVFLETAERMNVKPENILVFEDSVHGIESAVRAGMNVVAIPYILNSQLDKWYYKSDLLFENGMESVDWKIIQNKFFR